MRDAIDRRSGPFAPRAGHAKGVGLGLLSAASLMTALHFNIVIVALPEIGREIGFGGLALQWVFSAFSVAYSATLLLGGRAVDLFGRRRMFIAALALFVAGSAAGGLASSQAEVIAARVVQGVGGAAMFPSILALLYHLFEAGPPRNRALALWASVSASGLVFGSVLGGLLVGSLGWRSTFFVNVPLGLVMIGMAARYIPADRPSAGPRSFDLAGAFTAGISVAVGIYALTQAPVTGWTSTATLSMAAASVVLFAAFVAIERSIADPLLPGRLVARPNVRLGMALAFFFQGTFMALPFFLSLLYRDLMYFSAFASGAAFLVPSIAIVAGTQIGKVVAGRRGPYRVMAGALAVGAIGMAALSLGIWSGTGYAALVPGLAIYGIGQGASWTVLWVIAGEGVEEHEQGVTSGVVSTALWVGGAVGLTWLALVENLFAAAGTPAHTVEGIAAVVIVAAGCLAATAVLAALAGRASGAR